MPRFIRIGRNGHVLEIVLDRPKANAITPEVGAELHQAFCELRDDPELRVAILTGAGDRNFAQDGTSSRSRYRMTQVPRTTLR